MIDLLWIIDSKKWIVDLKKRKYIWLYWLGKVVIFIFLGAVMMSDLAFIGAVIIYFRNLQFVWNCLSAS